TLARIIHANVRMSRARLKGEQHAMPRQLSLASLPRELLFPGSFMKYSLEEIGRLCPGESIVALTTRTGAHIGLLLAAGAPTPHDPLRFEDPWHLLFFYGNGTYLAACNEIVTFFQQFLLHVLIAEYEGYGMSSGQA